MECTVRMPRNLLLAAEVKVPVLGIADGPAAIAGQEREHRLPLSRRNYHVVVSERSRRALIYAHKSSYTKRPCASLILPSNPLPELCQTKTAAVTILPIFQEH